MTGFSLLRVLAVLAKEFTQLTREREIGRAHV